MSDRVQPEPPQKVVLSDVDISFERAIKILFTWTFAALIVNSVLLVAAIIVVVVLVRGQ